MNHRALSLATGTIAAIAAFTFLALGAAADRAMDKSGLGDPIRHAELSSYAGASFYFAAGCWLLCIIFSQFAPQPYKGRALFLFGLLVPVVSAVAWFALVGAVGA